MPKTSRRKFLGCGGSLLVAPFLSEQPLTEDESLSALPLAEPPWREPGQTKDAAYLRSAALRYSAEGREIVGRNRTCFNNRPLYCEPATEGAVLAGDRPFLRLIAKPNVLGGFSAAIVRDGAGKWFHEYSQVESRYRCGRMTWRISDPALTGVNVVLNAVPMIGAAGFALRLLAQGLRAGDKMIWAFGGARSEGDVRWRWGGQIHGFRYRSVHVCLECRLHADVKRRCNFQRNREPPPQVGRDGLHVADGAARTYHLQRLVARPA